MVTASGIVPDVSGMSVDDAKAALQNAGYNVGNVVPTQDGAPGRVTRSDPVANTQLRPGESVNILFNAGH
jgi:serine/threonine-protein kinase